MAYASLNLSFEMVKGRGYQIFTSLLNVLKNSKKSGKSPLPAQMSLCKIRLVPGDNVLSTM